MMGAAGYSHGTAGVLECVAASARRKGRAAMQSCAGAYVSGAADSNECPAGSARIETAAACRTAALAAGKPLGAYFVETRANYPRGCYYSTTYNYAAFNAHAVGAGASWYQLLCAAVATAGAPFTR